ncbi:rod shape-determining protein MreD [Sporolactobacillus sp. THM7-7]|nr:rod shape-determining protein MreD [Sporolactobacillus sp. THM7-7]
MKQLKLFLFLFLIFIFQGTVMMQIPVQRIWNHVQMVPNFLLVAILMIAFFAGPRSGVQYGILFGFLVDLNYTSVIGVYAFSLGLTVYLIASLSRLFNMNVVTTVLLSMAGVCLHQLIVYVIYSMIGVTGQPFTDFLQWRLPATLILNSVFALIIYYPFRRFLRSMSEYEE